MRPTSLVRTSVERGLMRSFGFKAFHKLLKKIVNVHEMSFDGLDRDASVSIPGSNLIFRVTVRDLVLLEDTSRKDKNDNPIFEGDRVRAKVQNEYGSWEMLEGVVLFDEEKWGFSVDFERSWSANLSGLVDEVEIIGNIFEHASPSVPTEGPPSEAPNGGPVL